MKTPVTYFEWKQLLDEFAAGNDSILPLLQKGEMHLDAGTATRFVNLIDQTYIIRKQKWIEQFNNSFRNQLIKNSSELSVVVNQAKAGLRILIQFSQLPPFSEDIKKMISEDLDKKIQEIKSSVKTDLLKNRNSKMNEMLLIFDNLDIKNVNVNQTQTNQEPVIPGKRKLIF